MVGIDERALSGLLDALVASGYSVFDLGGAIGSKAEFFDRIVATVPLEPPLARVRDVWDALSDSLESGLIDAPASAMAIVWRNPLLLKERDPDAYRVATE